MKMNVPEKIYISPKLEERTWLIGKFDVNAIEYVNTDAFIEKACKYFRNKKKCIFECIGENVYHSLLNEEEIENFRNYMEGKL